MRSNSFQPIVNGMTLVATTLLEQNERQLTKEQRKRLKLRVRREMRVIKIRPRGQRAA